MTKYISNCFFFYRFDKNFEGILSRRIQSKTYRTRNISTKRSVPYHTKKPALDQSPEYIRNRILRHRYQSNLRQSHSDWFPYTGMLCTSCFTWKSRDEFCIWTCAGYNDMAMNLITSPCFCQLLLKFKILSSCFICLFVCLFIL